MKLLVFAHTPPPHHGQSYMVQHMLEGFGGDCRAANPNPTPGYGIDCYHVNARFSSTPAEIGGFQFNKVLLLLRYCAQAIWCRIRYGIGNLYYVPAPGQRTPLYRDWLVMLLCRPFFKRVILHWHAAGMPAWVETTMPAAAWWLTVRLLGNPVLSIVLSNYNRVDAEKIFSKTIKIVGNGIPDPCPHFKQGSCPNVWADALNAGQIYPARVGSLTWLRFFTWRIARAKKAFSTPSTRSRWRIETSRKRTHRSGST